MKVTKVMRIHPLGTMNICSKFHCSQSVSHSHACQKYFSGRPTDWQTLPTSELCSSCGRKQKHNIFHDTKIYMHEVTYYSKHHVFTAWLYRDEKILPDLTIKETYYFCDDKWCSNLFHSSTGGHKERIVHFKKNLIRLCSFEVYQYVIQQRILQSGAHYHYAQTNVTYGLPGGDWVELKV